MDEATNTSYLEGAGPPAAVELDRAGPSAAIEHAGNNDVDANMTAPGNNDVDANMTVDEPLSTTLPAKRKLEDLNDTLQDTFPTIPDSQKVKKKPRVDKKENGTLSDKATTQRKKPGRKPLNKSTLVVAAAASSSSFPADTTTIIQEDPWKNLTPPEPEADPEKSLDVLPEVNKNGISTGVATTVHWDPHSLAGQKVGYRVRIYQDLSDQWRSGRILRYDPVSHKYKIDFAKKKNHPQNKPMEEWIDLKDFSIYMSGRFVWALVKGHAWWPAQVLTNEAPIYQTATQGLSSSSTIPRLQNHKNSTLPRDVFSEPPREGYLLVEFFDSGELASIKDSPESIRPFSDHGYMDDPIMKKNKKRPSPVAIELCKQEKDRVQQIRNDAAQFYARKAFAFANKRAHSLLGRKVKLFRRDLNYPHGEHVVGTIRQYSCASKKWLVVFDPWPTNKAQYDPGWFSLLAKDVSYTLVDQQLKPTNAKIIYEPTNVDLIPFLFGFDLDASSQFELPLTPLCHGCLIPLSTSTDQANVLKCVVCSGQYHPGCIDPLTLARLSEANPQEWMCHKCIPCVGCKQRDIAFGIKTISSPPPSLNLKSGESLDLCSSCTPLYENKMFCPVCTHVWDDVKFQKVQRRLLWNAKMKNVKLPPNKRLDLDLLEMGMGENPKLDWYYPETRVWGYTESTMVQCDMCNLWVHAGCAPLTKEEYEKTIEGSHPIYSKEYLCRVCCKKRCLTLMEMLQSEDSVSLFANPVTDQMAHNYHDIIKNPMDLSTMYHRALRGEFYNYAWIRESFELMVYNALTFNRPFTKFWNEARRFHDSCITNIFNVLGKAAPPSTNEKLINSCISKAFSAVQAEIDREQTDATAEKKDALAGAQVVTVNIGPLSAPVDPKSCIYFTENRISPIDAFFLCWMECCFICGSSGAMDTLLHCVDCGEAFHSFCCNAPIQSMTAVSLLSWRCPNCKVCEISGIVPIDDSKLLMCEMCDRALSVDLINPTLSGAPKGLWICGFCVDCKYCDNLSGDVDRTMWSMLPDMCYRCGGAAGGGDDGILDVYKCSVCDMFSLPTDTDLLKCSHCKKYIHKICADQGEHTSKSGQFRCFKCCEENSRLTQKEYSLVSKEEPQPRQKESSLPLKAEPQTRDIDIPCYEEEIDEFFPSDELLQMISSVRSQIPQTPPMFVLNREEHSTWWLKPRIYAPRYILEDALMLNQIIRSYYNDRFHKMLDQQLERDAASLPFEIYGKAVRFACLLRVREKQRARQAVLRKICFMDKEYRSILTDMACSYICAGCILFGLDISIFFPFLTIPTTTVPFHAPLSAGREVEDSKDDQLLLHLKVYPDNGNDTASSVPYILSCECSLVNFDLIAQVIADLRPVDDPVETMAFTDAVFALFQMSHQSQPVGSNVEAASVNVEYIMPQAEDSVEHRYEIYPNVGSSTNGHEQNGEGRESSCADAKPADDILAFHTIESKRHEEHSLGCNGLSHSGPLRTDGSHSKKMLETSNNDADTKPNQVFEQPVNALKAPEGSSDNDSMQATTSSLRNDIKSSSSALPVSDEILNIDVSQDEINKDENRASGNWKPCGSELPALLDINASSCLIAEDAFTERRSSETAYPTNVICSHPKDEKVLRVFQRNKPSLVMQSWRSTTTVEVKPMVGWSSSYDDFGINNGKEWKDTRMCCLCMTCGDDDADSVMEKGPFLKKVGRLLPLQGSWVHVECALWSSEVWRDIATGTLFDVQKARRRGSQLKCHGCGRVGATVGCNKMHCKSNYHFACAAACGAVFTNSKKVYCFRHKDVPKDCAFEGFSETMECLKVDQSDTCTVPESDNTTSLRIGALTVHSFGHIDQDSDAFHSKNYIFPQGFTTSRIFWSSVAPKKRTVYIMNVSKSSNGKALFSIRSADSKDISYRGTSVKKVYEDLIQQVLFINQSYFSSGEKDSIYPIYRSPKRRAYGLNGPQFFGFGLDSIRKVLERSAGAASCAVPLSDKSETYRFCFTNPAADDVTAIQRKRALVTAEKSLQNSSGCARAEGMNAVHKSVGSGRITRALVRRAEDDTTIPESSSGAFGVTAPPNDDYNKKYQELKAVPFEEKLVAKRSHIHGWGLFAKVCFPKNSMIIEYMGETIRQCIADIKEREYEDNGIGSCYMFRLDFERIVDATTVGCMARFMNHSCSPNCYAKVILVTDDLGVSDNKIIIFASKEIAAGDEITYDYKFPVEDGSLRCSCGAPNCIGRMN